MCCALFPHRVAEMVPSYLTRPHIMGCAPLPTLPSPPSLWDVIFHSAAQIRPSAFSNTVWCMYVCMCVNVRVLVCESVVRRCADFRGISGIRDEPANDCSGPLLLLFKLVDARQDTGNSTDDRSTPSLSLAGRKGVKLGKTLSRVFPAY